LDQIGRPVKTGKAPYCILT